MPITGASEDDAGTIKRIITLKAKDAPKNLYFRVAQGALKRRKSFEGDELAISVKGESPLFKTVTFGFPSYSRRKLSSKSPILGANN